MNELNAVVLIAALLGAAGTATAGQDEFQRMRTQRVMDEKRAAELERWKQAQAGLPVTPEKESPRPARPPGTHP
jgi:hypothetical protein